MKELIKEQLFQFALLIATDDWNRVLDFCITNNTDVRSATEQLTRYIECRYLRENKIKKLSEIPDSLKDIIFKLTDDGQWKQLCHLMHNEGVLISTVITIWQDQCPQDGGGFPLAISINLSKLCDQYASEHPEDHLWLAIKA